MDVPLLRNSKQEAASIAFAIILLTPDDVGALAADKADPNPRARQNVILELGYFVGKLGRQRVCPLYKGDVEIPSDILGVLYIPFDAEGVWKPQLMREMEAAGLVVKTVPILSARARESDRLIQVTLLPNLTGRRQRYRRNSQGRLKRDGQLLRDAYGQRQIEPALVAQEQWNAYNMELLSRCFDGTELAEKYKEVTATPNAIYQRASRGKTIMRSEIERGIRLLTSILQRLKLLPNAKLKCRLGMDTCR